jgi:acyl-homoserine-lactone acylase
MLKQLFALLLLAHSAAAQIDPSNITIARDEYGVPHIFAKTDAEVAYGLAWASAEDLFPTMQEMLYAGKGFSGRYQGKDGAGRDFVTHTLGIQKLVDERYEQDISPEFKRYLEGFCQGVNAYAKKHWKDEKFIKKAFPITPQDVVASYVFSLSIISNAHKPIQKIIGNKFDKEEVPMGSNAFAMSSAVIEDGSTYLAVNPHMPYDGPFSWYEAHLNSEEGLNILGGLFPGGVSVFLGTNENLGWSHTWNGLDLVDTYKLKMHPKKKLWYEYDGEWLKLEKRPVWLKVKVGGIVIPVRMVSYWSKYGPTLRSKKGKMFYSVRCPASEDIRVANQWFNMNKARNFTEFKSALDMLALGRFNIVYADRNDTIYYIDYGMIPDRDTTFDYKGLVPGNTSKTNWTSLVPVDDLPQYLNPESGYVFNTNNAPFNATGESENLNAADYHPHMGFRIHDNNRSVQFQNLMKKHGKISWEEFKEIKWDQQIPENHIFIQSMKNAYNLDASKYPDIADGIAVLHNWDYGMGPENMQAAFAYATTQKIMKKTGRRTAAVEEGLFVDDSLWVWAIRKTKEEFMLHFNKLEMPFGDVQTFTRSGKTVGLGGIADVLAAAASEWDAEAGTMNSQGGDTYVQLVRFTKEGLPQIESLMAGGNSDRPDSPHFNDQMDLLENHKTKPMTLDKAEVLKNAVKTYHPE